MQKAKDLEIEEDTNDPSVKLIKENKVLIFLQKMAIEHDKGPHLAKTCSLQQAAEWSSKILQVRTNGLLRGL